MGFLSGKKLLITGVLSNRSIAYGIAKACHAQGAELAFSYVGERFKDRITEFAADFGSSLVFDCDVGDDAQIEAMFKGLSQTWPQVRRLRAQPSASRRARRSPATSSTACRARPSRSRTTSVRTASRRWPRRPFPMLNDKSALLTLTYLGAIRTVPTTTPWAWPRRRSKPRCATWRSRSVPRACASTASAPARSRRWRPAASRASARSCRWWPRLSPIRRNVTIDDVGNVAAFLLSDLAGGVSAEITYVDGGFSHVVGGIDEPAA
jgi:enoyl-[acyl-carrier protein] reductase I